MPPAQKTLTFLIVGAGPGGLASASSIRRHLQLLAPFDGSDPSLPRVDYGLFEQKNNVSEHVGVQYSLALGNAERWDAVFGDRGLGIAASVDPTVMALREVRYVMGGTGEEVWTRLIPAGSDEGRFIGQVKRATLVDAMASTVPADKLEYRKKVVRWREWEEDGGGVEIEFEDGSKRRGDYIIAADGVFSPFRYAAYPKSDPTMTDIGSIYCLARVPAGATDAVSLKLRRMANEGVSLTSLAKDSLVGFFPLKNDEFCIFCEVRKPWELANLPPGQTLEQTPFEGLRAIGQRMAREEHAAFPELEAGFNYAFNTGQPVWRLKHLPTIPSSLNGRVLLVGDAAHAMLPYLGRGAVTAIEDGATLGPALRAGLLAGKPPSQILREYAAARTPATKAIYDLALRECDNWWEIGAGRRDKGELVLAQMDRSRRAKAAERAAKAAAAKKE